MQGFTIIVLVFISPCRIAVPCRSSPADPRRGVLLRRALIASRLWFGARGPMES